VNDDSGSLSQPARVTAAGNKPKLIDEYIGRVNSETTEVSVAHMRSPGGWIEPGQTPDFEEYTVVLKGVLRVEYKGGTMDVAASGGNSAARRMGKYSTPGPDGAEYIRRLPSRFYAGCGASGFGLKLSDMV